jgi:hypothetical protein
MATDNVLDLNTIVEKLHVRIDGVPHHFSHPDALTLQGHLRMERIGPRMGALLEAVAAGATTDADDQELALLLDEGCRLVLDAPDSVHAKLLDTHRVLILDAFTQLRLKGRAAEATLKTKARPRRGVKSSPGSSASTAALRRTG